MRPRVQFLDRELLERIVGAARELLCTVGIEVHCQRLFAKLADHGADVDTKSRRAKLSDGLIDRALASVPRSFALYDVLGEQTHDLGGSRVHFTPGSAAIRILDNSSGELRQPLTADVVNYVKLLTQLPHIASQSTGVIPADVPEAVSDSYRLFLALSYGEKPVVTGTFTVDAFKVMRDLQLCVRGSAEALAEKTPEYFFGLPDIPLKWSELAARNVVDCAESSIPVEIVAMPLAGFTAPVTLVGTLIAHTAEVLSGVVISQITQPGARLLYGGSPAVFDIRYETTPMGAVETQMIACAYAEIGDHLGIPTQAYIALSDSKALDAQAGLESSMGATLAALAGINNISGPGMLDFESCQSLEKLVVDHEICGMVLRLVKGVEPKEDFPALEHFRELLAEQHLLIYPHTRRHLRDEHYFPGPLINRASHARWLEEGATTLRERAAAQVAERIAQWQPSRLSAECQTELNDRMTEEAQRFGMSALPAREPV